MIKKCDVLVVGAATTGIYFGWIMAKKGHSVLIIDKEAPEQVGQRLEVIHFVQKTFAELNMPPPTEAPELIKSWKGIYVSRLPLWLQRMYKILESDGVKFEFLCKFKNLLLENGRIRGCKVEKQNEEYDVEARLVVDASGVACAVRSSLPENYGVETWKYDSSNRFFVILNYFKWLKPDEPHPDWGEVWPYYFVFIDPGYSHEEPIVGIIGPESFKTVEAIWNEFVEEKDLPPFEITKKELNSFPLTISPYSLVGDGFFCAGDAAAMMNPIAARGIPETWQVCTNAGEVVSAALKKEDYLTRERLWEINFRYFRNEGAELAYQYMISSAIFNLNEKDINFLLKKLRSIFDPPEGEDEETDLKLSAGKMAKAAVKVLGAIFTGKVSIRTLFRILKKNRHGKKIKKHYQKYPENPENFDEWVQKAEKIWELREVLPRKYKTITVTYP